MHVHNVNEYAPPGHKLARTDYEGGATVHVFTDSAGVELKLQFCAADAAEEIGYLEKFRDMHTPAPEPVAEPEAAPAKPSRKRS